MIASGPLMDAFVEMADTLVDEFDLIDFLHHLAEHTAAISEASSVGLLLGDHDDRLTFMAATSSSAEHLELYQIQNREGPCLDCFRIHQPVIVTDLSKAEGGGQPSRRSPSPRDFTRCMRSRCGCGTRCWARSTSSEWSSCPSMTRTFA